MQSDEPHTTVGPEGLDLGVITLEVASSISGTISGDAGPIGSIEAMACRDDGFCYPGYSDESGSFSVAGLTPGSYVLQFNDWMGTYQGGYYSESGIVGNAFEATPFVVPPSVSGLAVLLERSGAIGAPGTPTNVYAIPGDGTAEVHWTPPLDDGGSPILEYTVASTDGTSLTVVSYTTECLVWGLTNGQPYSFTVVARNAAGYGEPSAPSDPVIPSAQPPAPVAVRLAATADPATITAGGAAIVTVSALDQDGNVVPDYAGTVSLSSLDPWSDFPSRTHSGRRTRESTSSPSTSGLPARNSSAHPTGRFSPERP